MTVYSTCDEHDTVEADCYVVTTGELILVSNYIAESMNQQQLISGRFNHVGLRKLCTKAYVAETSYNQLLLID